MLWGFRYLLIRDLVVAALVSGDFVVARIIAII
jgi:hypothetical protein